MNGKDRMDVAGRREAVGKVCPRYMAVWTYDRPPFYLAAEIEEMWNDGSVVVRGFGGMRFMPVKVLPYDRDKIDEMNNLRNVYEITDRKNREAIKDRAEEIMFLK